MKTIIIFALIMATSVGFAKTATSEVEYTNIAAAKHIDARREAFVSSLGEVTDAIHEKVAKKLKLDTSGTNALQAIIAYVQPMGDYANYMSLIQAEVALGQQLNAQ